MSRGSRVEEVQTMKTLLAVLFFSVSSFAALTEKVPALQLTKTGNFVGQYAVVYYGIGRQPLVTIGNKQLIFSQANKVSVVKIEGDTLNLPAVELKREGVRDPYNMVVVVLTPHADFVWKNPDQSVPSPLKDTGVYQYSHVAFLTKDQVDSFVATTGINGTFVWALF
jgi:hypothetical protein